MNQNLNCKILMIEDNLLLATLIKEYLVEHGCDLVHISKGLDINSLPSTYKFDLIICDVMLPDIDGFTLQEELQSRFDCPVIFLTALSDAEDHIKGLELGAVDYIVKPVEPNVLLARIRANLRKSFPSHAMNTIEIGDLTLNKNIQLVMHAGNSLDLTNHDFELLWIFAQNQGNALSREYLSKAIVGREYNGLDRIVDARTMRLRKKIKAFNIPGLSIKTVWGKGYLFTYTQPKSSE